MTRVKGAARQTFRALESRNYRLYFFGQIVSVSGTWMQTVALGWLVLQITGSGTWLGLVIACQFLPMLVLAPMGGVVADRVDKRRFLFVTQAATGTAGPSRWAVVLTGAVQLWMVFAFALGPRHRQRLRHARPPDLRVRDGRTRPARPTRSR